MTKRMQVLVEEREYGQMQQVARQHGMTLAEWVRQTLRRACRQEPHGEVDEKLARVRTAVEYEFPAPDIDQMLAEIARGYDDGPDS